MMSNIVAITLLEKYYELGGKIFADYMLRNKADDETKKSLEAIDFMNGLMNGNIKTEWKLEDSTDYQQLIELAQAINRENKEE